MNKKCYPALLLAFAGMSLTPLASNAQLSGNYSINPALPANAVNFQSFTTAVSALSVQGVSGPVSFYVASGTYNEQIIIPAITGASATKNITFVGNGATIIYNPTNGQQRAVVKLDGADHIILDSLNITATGTTATEYGYGVQLMNNADSNSVKRCTITLNKSTTSSIAYNYAGIVINSAADSFAKLGNSACDGNLILSNKVIGGYYGITLAANGTTFTISNNRVVNNVIQDFYNTGIYLNGTFNTLVDNNDISRPDRPTTATFLFFGIYLQGGNSGLVVSNNRVHDPFGNNTTANSGCYGFYFQNSSAVAGNENQFYNNSFYRVRSNGIGIGFDLTNSSGNKFYHNSVSLDDAFCTGFGSSRGFSIYNTSANTTLINNVVRITRGGGGPKHCVYVSGTPTGFVSNNNDWYMAAAGTINYLGYYGTANRNTFVDWQTGSSQDAAGMSIDPAYVSDTVLMPTATALLNAGQATAVTRDITGANRSATTPTPGAYELNTAALCAAPSALSISAITPTTATAGWTSAGSYHKVQYGPAGFNAGNGITSSVLTANSYAFSNLSPATIYHYYVQDSCSTSSKSAWVGPFAFTTACAPASLNLGNDTTICAGATVVLNTGTIFGARLWNDSTAANTRTVTTPGIYAVRITNAIGCPQTDSIAITQTPKVSLASFTATINPIVPLQVSFTATGVQNATGYLWSFGDGTTSTQNAPSHLYTTGGSYTVSLKVQNACGDTTITRPLALAATGIGNRLKQLAMDVYPNPATSVLELRLSTAIPEGYELRILDATGRVMTVQHFTGLHISMPVGNLPAGVYVVQLRSKDAASQIRFVKQ